MPGSTVKDELPEAGTSPKLNTVSVPTTIVSSRRPGTPCSPSLRRCPGILSRDRSIGRRASTNQPTSGQGAETLKQRHLLLAAGPRLAAPGGRRPGSALPAAREPAGTRPRPRARTRNSLICTPAAVLLVSVCDVFHELADRQ